MRGYHVNDPDHPAYSDDALDDRGAPTHTCEACGTIVREGRECLECVYGLEEEDEE